MLVGIILGILFGALLSGLLIWIVGKLGLGLEVDNFGAAFVAGIIIGIVAGVINWLLGLLGVTVGGGVIGAIIHLVIAAVVLLISDRIVRGMRVKGFTGAIVAAIAIGVVAWLITLVLSAVGVAVA